MKPSKARRLDRKIARLLEEVSILAEIYRDRVRRGMLPDVRVVDILEDRKQVS